MSEVARLQLRTADPQADLSLPGWLYHDPEYFAVEMERLIRSIGRTPLRRTTLYEASPVASAGGAVQEPPAAPAGGAVQSL